jgi:hypothetical protein
LKTKVGAAVDFALRADMIALERGCFSFYGSEGG